MQRMALTLAVATEQCISYCTCVLNFSYHDPILPFYFDTMYHTQLDSLKHPAKKIYFIITLCTIYSSSNHS